MKITNKKNLPGVIVRALEADKYDGPTWAMWPNVISCTTLIAPPRIAALKRMHDADISQDASNMLYALQGRALHTILESGAKPGGLYELRMEKDFFGTTVSAQLDAWEDGVLYDYKWTESKPKDIWEEQLNIEVELLEAINVKTTSICVVAFRRGWIEVVPMNLWSADKRDAFIMDRVEKHRVADLELPKCTDEEIWGGRRCQKYCLVAPFCTQWLDKKDSEG